MNRWLAFALVLLAGVALGLRVPHLDQRPMHNDEAVNALLVQRLWERGEYRYQPEEFHGPTLVYASLPFVWWSGANDFDHLSEGALRGVAVAAGVALVLLLWLLRDALGVAGTAAAAALLTGSPALVFYSRYFIHEMLLVAFTLLLLGGAWRYGRSRQPAWAVVAGLGLGLMAATKETFVFTIAALGLAALVTVGCRRAGGGGAQGWVGAGVPRGILRDGILALGVAAFVSLLFFTSFLTHARGPLDALLTYLPWLRRAGGQTTHVHPWWFYFERLFWFQAPRGPRWSEALIGLLAVVGVGAAVVGRGLGSTTVEFARFLAAFMVFVTGIYCAIPYKTPWCLLNFLLPMILLAGLGAAVLLRAARTRSRQVGILVVLAIGWAHLGWQAWRGSQALATHRGNPYVYSPTVPNVRELADRVKAIALVSPRGVNTDVRVVAPESGYWPLPWYLRQLRAVGWHDTLPEPPYAPIMVVAASLQAGLDEKTQRRHLSVGYYELRPREFFELYVEYGLWKRFVETLPRPAADE